MMAATGAQKPLHFQMLRWNRIGWENLATVKEMNFTRITDRR